MSVPGVGEFAKYRGDCSLDQRLRAGSQGTYQGAQNPVPLVSDLAGCFQDELCVQRGRNVSFPASAVGWGDRSPKGMMKPVFSFSSKKHTRPGPRHPLQRAGAWEPGCLVSLPRCGAVLGS